MRFEEEIRERLARLEAKLEDLPEIKREVQGLRVRVAGIAASVGGIVAFAGALLTKLLG